MPPGKEADSNPKGFHESASPQVRDVGEAANWRSNPLSSAEALTRVVVKCGCLNPLFEAPWVTTDIFKMDWLHAADQGVAADFIGNLFFHFVDQFPGDTKEERYNALFAQADDYYEAENVQDRLDCLKPTSVEHKNSGMKLRCSAAKCRKLVPFAFQLAQELCNKDDPVEEALYWAAFHLNECYKALSASMPPAACTAALKQHSTKFALQYVSLHDHCYPNDNRLFRIKPKLHFFLHLCSDGGDPAKHWCYRDEDFGGSVARVARRRGGLLKVAATSKRVLESLQLQAPRISIR